MKTKQDNFESVWKPKSHALANESAKARGLGFLFSVLLFMISMKQLRFILLLVLHFVFATSLSFSQQAGIDTLYYFKPDSIDIYPIYTGDIDSAGIFFIPDSDWTRYEILELHFLFIPGLVDSTNPAFEGEIFIRSGERADQPGNIIAKAPVQITGVHETYPNWKIISLLDVPEVKNLQGTFWLEGGLLLSCVRSSSISKQSYLHSAHTLKWQPTLDIAVRAIVRKQCAMGITDRTVKLKGNDKIIIQDLNSNVTMNSCIAVVSARDALAYNNSIKLVRGHDGQIHLVYHDQGEIFYTTSSDNGTRWSLPVNISNSAGESVFPTLAVDSTRKHFAWQDDSDPNDLNRVDDKQRIWFRSYRINDNSYRLPYRIGEAVGDVLTPSLTVIDERTLMAAWAANMGLMVDWEINISTGSLIGSGLLDMYDWQYPTIPGQDMGIGRSFFPSIATLGEVSYVAWQELNPFGTYYASFKYHRTGKWSVVQYLVRATLFPGADDNGIPALTLSEDTTAFMGFGLQYHAPPVDVDDAFVVSHANHDSLDENDGTRLNETPNPDWGITLALSFSKEIIATWEEVDGEEGAIYFSKVRIDPYEKIWSKPIRVSELSVSAHTPQTLAISPDTILFVWLQGNTPPFQITATKFYHRGTSVKNDKVVPEEFSLISASIYPNPGHTRINLDIELMKPALLSIKIYDIKGQMVKRVAEHEASSGKLHYVWNATNEKGSLVAQGIYFIAIEAFQARLVRKQIVIR